ncbi:archease [Halobacteria archaeon AArc-m2/3/4]|uniref:Archease n=1 Tax=Natronoglomus mannanivorans TaxID=2979990 RepID=A0ABT2Q9M0_9EURY|nr:archease [Halobacteria archaeon AArc-m2/3/4]
MPFELREHTADIAVEARGESLERTVAAVADGLAAASCDEDEIPADAGERFDLSVVAESREALLFEYLDELIYLRDVRLELPVENRVRIQLEHSDAGDAANADAADATSTPDTDDATDAADVVGTAGTDETDDRWSLEGSARGVPLTEIDAREIKAVTYSEMRLEAVDGDPDSGTTAWEAYVVFDV